MFSSTRYLNDQAYSLHMLTTKKKPPQGLLVLQKHRAKRDFQDQFETNKNNNRCVSLAHSLHR